MNIKPSMLLTALRRTLPLLLLAIILAPFAGRAQSQYMSYQGYLTDGNGNALGSTNTGPKAYDVVFRIWDLSTGGTIGGADDLFAELQTVTVDNGYFSVLLGQGTSYQSEPHGSLSSVFTSLVTPRYVEMTVLGIAANGASVTILPRLQLVAAPYSLLAVNAINVTGTNVINANNIATNLGLWQSAGNNINYPSGNVGINTATPGFPLTFSSTDGDKISLYGQSGNYYGFAVQPSLLQIHSDVSGSDIAFGTGQTSSFSELMRVKGTGNVGIGTSSPGSKLEVNGTFTSDGTATFNNTANFKNNATFNNPVGIGTGSPAEQLEVNGNALIDDDFIVGNDSYLYGQTYFGANVGIGTASPSAPLHIVTGNDVAGIVSSSSTIGTWMDIQNTGGGTNWDIISTGSGNGGGGGNLIFCSAVGPGTTENQVLSLLPNGYVGVNTGSPGYPLDVEGGVNYDLGGGFWYAFTSGSGIAGGGSHVNTITIKAGAGIQSGSGLYVTSDRRIKKDFVRSDSKLDLDKINQLQVTDFNYVDVVQYGNKHKKGLIAQEVEKVFPNAINKATDVVPDIYKMADYKEGWVVLDNNLKKGERVRLITQHDTKVCQVLEATKDKFRADFKPEGDKVFVFGREVNDFRSVDYDDITVLNVSATQELSKRMDALEKRESHLAALEKKAAQVDSLEQEVAELKKVVAQLAQGSKAGQHLVAQPAPADDQASLIPAGLRQ